MNYPQSFSARQGLARTPEIEYRDSLPQKLREPIFAIFRDYVSIAFRRERTQDVVEDIYGRLVYYEQEHGDPAVDDPAHVHSGPL